MVGAATIETGVSVVKEIIAIKHHFCGVIYFCRMKIIGTAEAARRLNVTQSRVRVLIDSGRLKAMKVGREWLIDPKDLDAVKDRKVGRPRKSRKMIKR